MKDQNFFERMGEVFNSPASKTKQNSTAKEQTEEDLIEEYIKDILNPASPEVNVTDQSVVQPEVIKESMQGNWWEKALNDFSIHQEKERGGFNMKQAHDQQGFASYQVQEKTQFDNFQKQEFEIFWANIKKQSDNRPSSAPAAPQPTHFNPPK
ncbi:MAG: hypothetical protein KAI79_18085 [Bacteroidales bacterium]|nr:hypothetical protein [Bacteroidales bacterium]